MPDGVEIDGLLALQDYVLEKKSRDFAHGFVRRITGYALGRQLEYSDDALIEQLTDNLIANEYRASSLIEGLATSTAFLTQVNLATHKHMKKSWHLSDAKSFAALRYLPWPALSGSHGSDCPKQASAPKRLACMFFPNGVTLPKESDPHHAEWHWFPKGEGKGFKLNKSTESFEPHRNDITFLSGLSHPAGRHMAGHGVSDVFLTAGPVDANSYHTPVSFDKLVAEKNGRDTRLPFLPLSVGGGVGTLGRTHTLSYTKTGQPIPAESNIRRCFNLMFGQEKDSLDKARRELLVRKSMLDGVLEDSARRPASMPPTGARSTTTQTPPPTRATHPAPRKLARPPQGRSRRDRP